MLENILIAVGSSGLTVGLLYAIFRPTINHFLAKELAKFQSSLDEKLDEQRIRFSSLHQKRADILGELYGRLKEYEIAVRVFLDPMEVAGGPTKEELLDDVNKAINTFQGYFRRHRIYLPTALCQQVDSAYDEMRGIAGRFALFLGGKRTEQSAPYEKGKIEAWSEGWDKMTEQIPKALVEVEQEFRRLVEV